MDPATGAVERFVSIGPADPDPPVVAAGALVLGWGVAQWDYLLPESLTVSQAAAPPGTITAVFVAVALAALLIVPAFVLLYVLDQKSLLAGEGVDEGPEHATEVTQA